VTWLKLLEARLQLLNLGHEILVAFRDIGMANYLQKDEEFFLGQISLKLSKKNL